MQNEEQPKKSHKTLRIVLGVLFSVIALFCAVRPIYIRVKTEREQKAQIAMANENAVRYVREKYGLEPEIVEKNKYNFITADIFGVMGVRLRAEGREFNVIAETTKESGDCLDDFQLDEIKAAFLEKLNEIQPGGKPVKVYFGTDEGGVKGYLYAYMFQEKFNGDNLDELLKKCTIELEMTFADVDFSKSALLEKLNEYGVTKYKLTSFDTEERRDEFMKLGAITDHSYMLYAPYITECVEFEESAKSRRCYNIGSIDDFQYCWHSDEYEKRGSGAQSEAPEVSECDDSSFKRHFDKDDEAYAISKPLSKTYKFNDYYGETCIYYPLSKFDDLDTVGAAWCIDEGIVNSYDILRAEVCGDNAVFTLPGLGEGKMFMLVDITDCKDFVPEWRKNRT